MIAALLAAVQPEAGLGLPRDVSAHGARIDQMLHVTTLLVTMVVVVLVAWMVAATILHGRSHTARHEEGGGRRDTLRTVGLAAVLFLSIDGVLAYSGLRDLDTVFWNFDAIDARPDVVRVEVDAHQWAWDFRYAGPDGAFNTADDVVALNELTVPEGAPVLLELAATDVIHSLYLPNLRIKTDAVPGKINTMWFSASALGDFEIACAQHCGVNHYKMKGTLHVVPKDAFEAWAAQATAEARQAYNPEDEGAHWGWGWRGAR